MRGIETQVRKVRRRVFKEVADLAYHSENLIDDMEALPYKIVPGEDNEYWESVYRERAVVRERIRLAMGMSLRPEDAPVHVSQGVEESILRRNIMSRRFCRLFHLPVMHVRRISMK